MSFSQWRSFGSCIQFNDSKDKQQERSIKQEGIGIKGIKIKKGGHFELWSGEGKERYRMIKRKNTTKKEEGCRSWFLGSVKSDSCIFENFWLDYYLQSQINNNDGHAFEVKMDDNNERMFSKRGRKWKAEILIRNWCSNST